MHKYFINLMQYNGTLMCRTYVQTRFEATEILYVAAHMISDLQSFGNRVRCLNSLATLPV